LKTLPDGSSSFQIDSKIKVQQELTDKYSMQNMEFMAEFNKRYHSNPTDAKAFYYSTKVKFDVSSDEGHSKKKRMLKKYLEGLQWVLFYYYKGAQHWRWYYPYHYAPMISDIGDDIVRNYLSGNVTIDEFETDTNCAANPYAYTPFQQLSAILPFKSFHLLPDHYKELVNGPLNEFFPDDFDIDLNGRALPWEAACLIPFVDENMLISEEQRVLQITGNSSDEQHRNTVSFIFKSFIYDPTIPKAELKPLESAIKKMKTLEYSYIREESHTDYENVGQMSFQSQLMQGVVVPNIDYPSFKWLGVQHIDFDEKVINHVTFKIVLVIVPSCSEE
jgi:5'-3' exonuclease